VLFEVLFYFEGGHAAGAGGGDGLAVAAVLNVSAGEDAGDDLSVEGGIDVVLGEDVAVRIEIHHALEGRGIGDMADAEEHRRYGKDVFVVGGEVLEPQAFDVLLFDTEDFFDGSAGEEVNFGMGHGAVEHDLRGAEFFAAVDQRDLGGEACEEESLFHGGVAAADDGDLFAGEEEAVAGGAGADAVADEGLFGWQVEPAGACSGGDDECTGVDGLLADGQLKGMFGQIDRVEVGHAELGAKANGLLLHVLDEVGALDAFGPAGEVFYQGGDGELAAGLMAFEDEGLEVRACGVDGGGESGAAGAEDDGVASRIFRHKGYLSVNARRRKRIQTGLWCKN
jgi:hypothetical protein